MTNHPAMVHVNIGCRYDEYLSEKLPALFEYERNMNWRVFILYHSKKCEFTMNA